MAVISNGTAVLGLGNIGPLAGKPVMEGKGVLFKRFADIDVFDIEVAETDPDQFIECVARLEPTFGGINLEDIKAPECFHIEEKLKARMGIPVFHDDQHGTAIISAAAFLNALELTGKRIEDAKVVFAGAGAAAIACANLYITYGVRRENMLMVDRTGVIYEGRTENMNPYKERFARKTKLRTLAEAMVGADAFIGVASARLVTGEMLKTMARDPIVFAMANPVPEILPEEAHAARPDVIMATGRSDYPNQVNNVLGFPFIFRGALDCRASQINEAMKLAAVHAPSPTSPRRTSPTPSPAPTASRGSASAGSTSSRSPSTTASSCASLRPWPRPPRRAASPAGRSRTSRPTATASPVCSRRRARSCRSSTRRRGATPGASCSPRATTPRSSARPSSSPRRASPGRSSYRSAGRPRATSRPSSSRPPSRSSTPRPTRDSPSTSRPTTTAASATGRPARTPSSTSGSATPSPR